MQDNVTPLFAEGGLMLGCNYWASHAGTAMWSDWRPDVIERDLSTLASAGLQWLRVFPLWPDFQPITQMRGIFGEPVEIRQGENPLPEDELGRAGLSRQMMERFEAFCDSAERAGLKLVAGLITGWMSGRLFVPPALEGRDHITDPVSISWQIRFCQGFVDHLKHHSAIAAWDLGNECNCMGRPPNADAAYLWTAALASTIRAADPSRPIVSGMHTLGTPVSDQHNPWLIEHQAELTDILTTHPYPYWVRHGRTDAVDAFRTTLLATAETRFYADIGGKPCIVEEFGTMGPMIASDAASADFIRVNMFSLWANDCRAMAWWCAHDQTNLGHAPYDWNGVEVELGLLRVDGSAKPLLEEMSAFRKFLASLPVSTLPPPKTEAICLLSHNQDDWAVAFGAYALAKQARLQLGFAHIQQPIPDASAYLLPCLTGANAVPLRKWRELIQRVENGATLYVSLADGVVPDFNALTGVTLLTRAKPEKALSGRFDDGSLLPLPGADDLRLRVDTATVLVGRQDCDSPVFWKHSHGRGEIYVFAAPLEAGLSLTPRAFDAPDAPAYHRVYAAFAPKSRVATIDDPAIALTEHVLPDGSVMVVAINHTASERTVPLSLKPGFAVSGIWGADQDASALKIARFSAAIIALRQAS